MPERAHTHECRPGGHWLCHPWEVWLDPDERRWADEVGTERLTRSRRRRGVDVGGRDELASHTFGARCELAMARILRIDWPATIDTFRKVPDLPPDIEVRGSHGSLDMKMREVDMRSRRRYALVLHRENLDTYRFVGWLVGTEAGAMGLSPIRRRADLTPAYWAPFPSLHAPDTFEGIQT